MEKPTQLAFRQYGESGGNLILLHGLFGSGANWGSIARGLAGRYRVYTPDLRNHGRSFHHPDMSYPALAADVRAFADTHIDGDFAIVGHSMGGKVAMQMALADPARVAGIAVVDMAPVSYAHRFDEVFAAMGAVDLGVIRNRADADAAMAGHLDTQGLRAFLLQNLERSADGWGWRINLEVLRHAQEAVTHFAEGGTPWDGVAHFIHGTASTYLRDAYLPEIGRLFPRAVLCPVEGAGHWVYAEQPAGFARCLEAFLAAL